MNPDKKSFVLYHDQYQPIAALSLEQKGRLLEAFFRHHAGEAVRFEDPVLHMAFCFFRQTFDRDAEKYERKCRINRENARRKAFAAQTPAPGPAGLPDASCPEAAPGLPGPSGPPDQERNAAATPLRQRNTQPGGHARPLPGAGAPGNPALSGGPDGRKRTQAVAADSESENDSGKDTENDSDTDTGIDNGPDNSMTRSHAHAHARAGEAGRDGGVEGAGSVGLPDSGPDPQLAVVPAGSARDPVSPPSPPAPYVTGRNRRLCGWRLESFNEFWRVFALPKGKAEAADAWLDIPGLARPASISAPSRTRRSSGAPGGGPGEQWGATQAPGQGDGPDTALLGRILAAAAREAAGREALLAAGRIPKMAQGWISGRRWEDEPENGATGVSGNAPGGAPARSLDDILREQGLWPRGSATGPSAAGQDTAGPGGSGPNAGQPSSGQKGSGATGAIQSGRAGSKAPAVGQPSPGLPDLPPGREAERTRAGQTSGPAGRKPTVAAGRAQGDADRGLWAGAPGRTSGPSTQGSAEAEQGESSGAPRRAAAGARP